jgi:hypothetical protein
MLPASPLPLHKLHAAKHAIPVRGKPNLKCRQQVCGASTFFTPFIRRRLHTDAFHDTSRVLEPWRKASYRLPHGFEDLQLSRAGLWSANHRHCEIAVAILLKWDPRNPWHHYIRLVRLTIHDHQRAEHFGVAVSEMLKIIP